MGHRTLKTPWKVKRSKHIYKYLNTGNNIQMYQKYVLLRFTQPHRYTVVYYEVCSSSMVKGTGVA